MNIDTIEAPTMSTRCYGARERMTLLPEDFQPNEDDVICGRGKKCYAHIGNDRFRLRVIGMLDEYRKAKSKLDKSKVLSDVVEQVRGNSPRGGFVKQDSKGRWFEVGDFLAREKTSQAFRDALHENYKSSNVSKKKRRQQDFSRDKMTKPMSDCSIESRMAKLGFGKTSQRTEPLSREYFARPSTELRHDFERGVERSRSSEETYGPRRAPPRRHYSAGMTTELNISELRGVETAFKPFYFQDRENGLDERSEILSRGRSTTIQPPQQSHSLPVSPMNVPTVFEDIPMELHHSAPNMHFSFDSRSGPSLRDTDMMHQSLPNMYYDESMDAVPDNLAVPDLSESRSRRTFADRYEPMTISSSLIDSLAKITESAGADEKPF
mmetsp:Transcript_3575/g.7135  ORF Transcript_3575/g.7135 Transcript_3575/m.7135 type:complete len:380 (-) Transcript_3575:17-1156(-)